MKIFLLLSSLLLLSYPAHAQIENKEFLSAIFKGCIDEDSSEFLDNGSSFEYCGCYVNSLSKQMSTIEVMKLGVEILQDKESAYGEMLENEKIIDIVSECLIKSID